MKNKKFIALIVLTLVIQLAFPFGLLYTNSYNRNFALEHSIDYKFKLIYANLYDGNGDEKASFSFSVGSGIYTFYNQKIAVTIGEDGFAEMSNIEAAGDAKCWFDNGYYRTLSHGMENFEFEDGIDASVFRSKVYEKDENYKRECVAYMTAKVYKGVFIPTGVYVGEEKLITFINDK